MIRVNRYQPTSQQGSADQQKIKNYKKGYKGLNLRPAKANIKSWLKSVFCRFKQQKNIPPLPLHVQKKFSLATNLQEPKASGLYIKADHFHDPEHLQQLETDAVLANYPYTRSLEPLQEINNGMSDHPNTSWTLNFAYAEIVSRQTGLQFDQTTGLIYDQESGLTAYILRNPKRKEVRLIFGGSNSGFECGPKADNSTFLKNQYKKANIPNALFNKVPASYIQAQSLAKALVEHTREYEPNCLVVLSGHSKGGGEAAFAALAQPEPLQALCFSSAELGKGLLSHIPEKNLLTAADYITHIFIKGDPVPHFRKLRGRLNLTHVGKIISLHLPGKKQGGINLHSYFADHISSYNKAIINSDKKIVYRP